MGTIFPKAIDLLRSFAQKTVGGLHALGATVRVTYNTEAVMRGALNALVTANAEAQTAKAVLSAAHSAQDAASEAAAEFIRVGREVLKSKLGRRYSVVWDQVGFFNDTLEVPESVPKRLGLVKSMEMYFAAHPENEVAGLVTRAIAGEVHETLAAAVHALAVARADQLAKTKARDTAAVVLTKRLRALRRELKEFLGNDDSRWLEFGFNIPSGRSVPAAPESVSVVPGAIGSAVVKWPHSVGATRYRVFRQVVGVDADFVHVDTLAELSKCLTGLPPGALVRFYVTAANEAGESLPSATVELVIP